MDHCSKSKRYNQSMNDLATNVQGLLGIKLTQQQIGLFCTFENELIEWNARFNLTAIHEPEKIRTKHFLDSLTCLLAMGDLSNNRLIDIGTGAGFPSIPLKIIFPRLQLTMVESVGKKVDFLYHLIQTLGLTNVEIQPERAESLGQQPGHRQKYDWAVARAVAILPVLVEYMLPFVKVGGAAIAMKGEGAPAEAHKAEPATRILGGHLRKLVPVTLPGVADERYLVIIDKVAATPDCYPRRVGQPSKKPL
jgi:16S rRNA (guanine527-N7)-methyltransferase